MAWRSHPLTRGIGRALCASAFIVPFTAAVVPSQGVCLSDRHRGLLLSPEAVAKMGARATADLLLGAVDDERAAAVREVAKRLIAASVRTAAERGDDASPLLHARVVVCARPWMNAFSLADGTVVVYTGALDAIDEEIVSGGAADWDEAVARLLSHELAHVAAQHTAEKANSLPVYAALSAAMLLTPMTATTAAVAYLLARELPSWRKFELEADAIGATMMESAGYDPHAAASALRARSFAPEVADLIPSGFDAVFDALHLDTHAPIPTVLCSHPHDVERAANLEALFPPVMSESVSPAQSSNPWVVHREAVSDDAVLR